MILINAIYFKDNWEKEFKPIPKKIIFMNFNKEPKETDFMLIKDRFPY